MYKINAYLNYPGTAEEAFNFYKSVLGGEFAVVQRFADVPGTGNLSPEDGQKMMHIALPIADNYVLMATDALESMGQKLVEGNNFHLSLSVDSEAEADRIFAGLSAGGTIKMNLEKTFWGDYFGMWTDKFGIQWMISYEYPKQ